MFDASRSGSDARSTPRRRIRRGRRALVPLVLSMSIAGCGALPGPSSGTGALSLEGLCIDGVFVRPGQNDLRQVLEWRFPGRARTWYAPGSPGPLVLVDAIAVDGVQRLGELRAAAVMSVETLDAFRAVPEYGARAREGAIVVVTRAGLAAGQTSRADSRLVTPCAGEEGGKEFFLR